MLAAAIQHHSVLLGFVSFDVVQVVGAKGHFASGWSDFVLWDSLPCIEAQHAFLFLVFCHKPFVAHVPRLFETFRDGDSTFKLLLMAFRGGIHDHQVRGACEGVEESSWSSCCVACCVVVCTSGES